MSLNIVFLRSINRYGPTTISFVDNRGVRVVTIRARLDCTRVPAVNVKMSVKDYNSLVSVLFEIEYVR